MTFAARCRTKVALHDKKQICDGLIMADLSWGRGSLIIVIELS
ncbi:unnamed protein product [Tenebrio molitor]|nr:unnamed protein product [Tenebrio molitor]